jgi:four helix bundle protein
VKSFVYRGTNELAKKKGFGLLSRLRRAASSVPANIAEGFGRRSTKDFLRYLETASGSLEETKYFLRLSKHLQYLSEEQHLQWKLDCAEAVGYRAV